MRNQNRQNPIERVLDTPFGGPGRLLKLMFLSLLVPLALGMLTAAGVLSWVNIIQPWDWVPVTGKVAELRQRTPVIAYEFEGVARTYIPQTYPRGLDVGEQVPILVDPVHPEQIRMADRASQYAGPVLLGFFGFVLSGVCVFLYRADLFSRKKRSEWSPPARGAREEDEDDDLDDDEDEEIAAEPEFRDTGRTLRLSHPKSVWRANLFWAGVMLVVLLLCLIPPDGGYGFVQILVSLMPLALFAFAVYLSIYHKSYRLTADLQSLHERHRFGEKQVPWSSVAKVSSEHVKPPQRYNKTLQRQENVPGHKPRLDFRLHDRSGKVLLKLHGELEPQQDLHQLLQRAEAKCGKRIETGS